MESANWTYLYYFITGWGSAFVLPTANLQQIPAYEKSQPEGLCIGAYMNVANALGIIPMYGYVLFIRAYGADYIPLNHLIYFMLSMSSLGCFVAAFFYTIVIDDKFSIFIYLATFIGGVVGSLGLVVMNAYLMNKQPKVITSTRAGGSFLTLMCGAVASIQQPGQPRPNFNVTLYMTIFGVLLIFPIAAFLKIDTNRLGLKDAMGEFDGRGAITSSNITQQGEKKDTAVVMEMVATASTNNPLRHEDLGGDDIPLAMVPHNSDDGDDDKEDEDDPISGDSSHAMTSSTGPTGAHRRHNNKAADKMQHSNMDTKVSGGQLLYRCLRDFSHYNEAHHYSVSELMGVREGSTTEYVLSFICISDSLMTHECIPGWAMKIFPYLCTISFVDFNTWGLLSAFVPFAYSTVSPPNRQEEFLSYAYQVAGVSLLLGDASTWVGHLPLLVIYICAGVDSNGSDGSVGGAVVLTLIFCAVRFIESHTVTSSLRKVSHLLQEENVTKAARLIGVVDQSVVLLGAVLATIVVATSLTC